jgi:hypothetical protein
LSRAQPLLFVELSLSVVLPLFFVKLLPVLVELSLSQVLVPVPAASVAALAAIRMGLSMPQK